VLYKEIVTLIEQFKGVSFTEERLSILNSIGTYIQGQKNQGKDINLNFVCTHNSRRSHLAQIWAQVMATYFQIPNVHCYSGGTEATALFPKVVETLSESGFKISKLSDGSNPVYAIKYGANFIPIIGFSKRYDAAFNPERNFAAIMTCGHADENCPFIPGAEKRIPFTFEDPKVFDGTELQTEKYRERSLEIAVQLYYVFSQINS
jgi:arsenate reductase